MFFIDAPYFFPCPAASDFSRMPVSVADGEMPSGSILR